MLKVLRQELNDLFAAWALPRKPALRRASQPAWLFVTNLPLLSGESYTHHLQILQEAGWQTQEEKGWLLLDKAVPLPGDVSPCNGTGEVACCISLLERHPSDLCPASLLRTLVKAGETSPQELEKCCARWHADWSVLLRKKQPLPAGLLPWLYDAARHHKEVSP